MRFEDIDLEALGLNNIKKEDKKVFVALGADYGNIGDIAITFAQRSFLQSIFPDRKIVEIPMFGIYEVANKIKEIINDDDICTIIGGGNFGNIYIECEEKRRFIIETFKNNKIITFPQSFSFTNTAEGINELQKSIDIYANHNDLSILIREEKSYNKTKSNFKNPTYLVPDIVFSLKDNKEYYSDATRENISICFRDDKEKSIDSDATTKLENLLVKNNLSPVKLISTHLGDVMVAPSERLEVFKDCLKKFCTSKVVITDRLHGMIFAIITNTPCIALDNTNKKISATYNTWIKDIPFVKLVENYNEELILKYAKELSNFENTHINLDSKVNFDIIKEILK